ncbi:MAG TPA: DegV family protein [Anaerolineales bacterium]
MKIVTDCAADMPPEELERYGVTEAPLYIQFPGEEIASSEISPDAFYDRLEAMRPNIPTTAMPSTGLFAELYSDLARHDPEILSIHISSGLSGTIQAARAAGDQLKQHANVHFWDTLTLSGGQRFQVLAAALAAQAGWTFQAIQERLELLRARTQVVYTLDTLEYLARGGRIGRVKALAGALLHLKPVIRVDSDGKYTTAATARTLQKSMDAITDHLQAAYARLPVWVTVLHGRFEEKARDLEQRLRQTLNIATLETLRISPVLGVHTGPGVVGAAVVPADLMTSITRS